MAHKNIVWLASYPKSGNTWLRIFIANYLLNRPEPVPINQVHRIGLGDSIGKTYAMVAGRPVDLSDTRAMLALRPAVLRRITNNGADINLVKTHNSRDRAFGVELIPAALTRSAVYVLRDPRDVVLSYARHYGTTLERTVEVFARRDHVIAADRQSVAQYLGTWSDHVRKWTVAAPFPVLVLRYEDLLSAPEAAFARLVEHLAMPLEPERLARAIRFASFEAVAAQERATGFVEKSPSAERFFHSGRAGAWRDALDPALARRIEADHAAVMKRHGYLQ